jgi:glycosyltransferase involved in cell wall biosynthesis
LKILFIHNSYQNFGGEDAVISAEISLLRSHNHEVATYFRSNDEIPKMSIFSLACQTLWSSRTISDLLQIIESFHPDVIHVHNTFPLISPSVYWVAARTGVPLVQTLHNFRLMCLNALYLRKGKVCEDCLGHLPLLGVFRMCYRGSIGASAVIAGMLLFHRYLGTYRKKVSLYIAFNEFCRNKFIAGGLPRELIRVKPNFVDDFNNQDIQRSGLLFVGRLSMEKGIQSLLNAALLLPNVPLRVAGEGPLAGVFDRIDHVKPLGCLSKHEILKEMNKAIALVVPSICYETFGLVIVEAFSTGTPVIVSRIGSFTNLVIEGESGLFFEPNNSRDLAIKMEWAFTHPDRMAEMGQKAKSIYISRFNKEQNYMKLMEIYNDAICKRQKAG